MFAASRVNRAGGSIHFARVHRFHADDDRATLTVVNMYVWVIGTNDTVAGS